jgi:AAA domain
VSRTPSPPQVRAAVSRCLAPAIPQERPHVRTQAPRADRSARRTCNRLPDRWPSWRRENNSREGTGDQRVGPTATPDEWQIMLFGDQNPPDKRDLVEGKLVQLGMRTAELGTNVVFDFGFWGKDERSALRWIAGAVGARSQVVYLPIRHEDQRRRVTNRFATTPGGFNR